MSERKLEADAGGGSPDEKDRAEEGGVGDVEAAGETTAAAAIEGPADTRPVGADTMVKVAGERGPGADE